MRFAHLVNPVAKGDEYELSWQQPITFESMRIAREFAKHEVELTTTCYPEDVKIIPDYFTQLSLLERSTAGKFKIDRKLPFIGDIIEKFNEVDSDYCIYTNVDIGLYPYFYDFVGWVIDDGVDSMSITRITKPCISKSVDDLPTIWGMGGSAHQGHDCFVFKRDILSSFDLCDLCVGMPWVGMGLLTNCSELSKNFNIIQDASVTFHIGDTREWRLIKYNDYRFSNSKELVRMQNKFKLRSEIKEFGKENYSNECVEFTRRII